MDDQVEDLEQNGVVRVVLVDILCDLRSIHDLHHDFINLVKLSLALRRREKLQKIKNLDLKPRASSLVIVIILSVAIGSSKAADEHWHQVIKAVPSHYGNHSS